MNVYRIIFMSSRSTRGVSRGVLECGSGAVAIAGFASLVWRPKPCGARRAFRRAPQGSPGLALSVSQTRLRRCGIPPAVDRERPVRKREGQVSPPGFVRSKPIKRRARDVRGRPETRGDYNSRVSFPFDTRPWGSANPRRPAPPSFYFWAGRVTKLRRKNLAR